MIKKTIFGFSKPFGMALSERDLVGFGLGWFQWEKNCEFFQVEGKTKFIVSDWVKIRKWKKIMWSDYNQPWSDYN